MTAACPRAPRGKKQQQTDPHGEDKKKKQDYLNQIACYVLTKKAM